MNKPISVEQLLMELKSSDFVMNCQMPMGYSAGLPILRIKNEQLCLLVPFLKYKMTGQEDKTMVFPIRYTVTLVLPERTVIGFSDLSFEKRFQKVSFQNPVGYFRHEAVRHLNKSQYRQLRKELLGHYDKVIAALLYDAPYSQKDEARMRQLLRMMVEPSLFPIYQALDGDFYQKYLA